MADAEPILAHPAAPVEVASVPLPTAFGTFEARAFECATGFVYLALVRGEVAGRGPVLARVHSECLTGDALGSLRCDCGIQLRTAMRAIAAADCGVVVYATGHEGRGIGLLNKLRAYVEQDGGLDTLDANLRLGLPVDGRDYRDAAAVLGALGVDAVRLMTNNPAKAEGLAAAGVAVAEVVPLATAPHHRNIRYLDAKRSRLGHVRPMGRAPEVVAEEAADVSALLGPIRPTPERPYVVLKYAQTLDGRIATATGDSQWISSEAERCLSHALRAACDAVLVGVHTVLRDDPRLTVRMVPGASPMRVVLDSTLRTPPEASILSDEAPTLLLTTPGADPRRRADLAGRGTGVAAIPGGPGGVDPVAALAELRRRGVHSLLVEGGGRVITSLLAAGLVDRLVVAVAPTVIGQGTEAVGDLATSRITDGIRLLEPVVYRAGGDVIMAGDIAAPRST